MQENITFKSVLGEDKWVGIRRIKSFFIIQLSHFCQWCNFTYSTYVLM